MNTININITAIVNNLPTDLGKWLAKNNGVLYITATPVEGELWYYALWFTEAEAKAEALAQGKIWLKVGV